MKRQMKRLFPRFVPGAVALLILLCAPVLLARPGTLKTKSGQTYAGDIKDNGDTYTVTVDKIDTQIGKADVASVAYSDSLEDDFKDRMSRLDPGDAEGRVKVARFAFDNGRYDLALQAISSALQIDPNSADALDMQRTVRAQMQLEQSRATISTPSAGTPASPAPDNTEPPLTTPVGSVPKHLLTPADINSIRQREIKPGEDIPIVITQDIKRKFAALAGINYSDFDALIPTDQLNAILQKGDPDMIKAVRISRDPRALLDFKRLVQPMVLRNCATSGCHGGTAGGKFILYNGTDTATTYTNFYIMEQFSMKTAATGGFFGGGGQRKMIERGDGAHSLLVDFALPAGQGDLSHPAVPNSGFNGIFHSREDRPYLQAVDWMDHELNLIAPDYGIVYTPPTAATQPATQPATLP